MRAVRKLVGAVLLAGIVAGLPSVQAHAAEGGRCRRPGAERSAPTPQVCSKGIDGQFRWLPVHVVNWYGDSLTWEAQNYARTGAAGNPQLRLTVQGLGGTAPCDWVEAVGREYERDHPEVVVLQFSGNAIFPCMRDAQDQPLTGEAWLEAYRTDLGRLIALVPEASVVLVGAPLPRTSLTSEEPTRAELINTLTAEVAAEHGARFVDAGAAVLDAEGNYADVLPCLFFEACAGLETGTDLGGNPVRSWDGVHFCPTVTRAVDGVVDPCPVYSSGAMRYATAVLIALDEALADRAEPATPPTEPTESR